MTKMRKLFSAVVASALAFGSLSVAPASAAAPAPTFEFLDLGMPITDTFGDMAEINDTLYFRGTDSGTQKLFKLDATDKAVAIDTSAVGPVQSIIGAFEDKLYIETEDQDGNFIAMMYDGTTFTTMPDFPSHYPYFEYGLEHNGKWYFEAEDEHGTALIYQLDGSNCEVANFGSPDAPVYLESTELVGVFDGNLMLAVPVPNEGLRLGRFLSIYDGSKVTALSGIIDYLGAPTLRKFPWGNGIGRRGAVFQDEFYFASTFEEPSDNTFSPGNGFALFKMSRAGVVTRVEPVEAKKQLTSMPGDFRVLKGTLYFREESGLMSSLRKVTGSVTEIVASDLGMLGSGLVFKDKYYFPTVSGVVSFDGTTVTQIRAAGDIFSLLNDVLLLENFDREGAGRMYVFDGTTETNIPSVIGAWSSKKVNVKGSLYLNVYSDVDETWQLAKLTAGTYVPPVTPVTPPTKVDTDNPALGSLTETKTFKGTRGAISFADGSGFDIDAKGKMYSRVKSKYLTTVAGSFVVTYKVGAVTKTWTCKIAKYGSTKKLKALPRNAILYKSKQACQLPAAAIKAMKTGSVTIKQNVTMTRLYATTAKAKTPAGKAIRPLVRKMTVKIGAVVN